MSDEPLAAAAPPPLTVAPALRAVGTARLPSIACEPARAGVRVRPVEVFPFRRPAAQARLRLLCLPYAGGAASLYRSWPALLAPEIDVCPVELPGRGVRLDEPLIGDMDRLCDGLTRAIAQLGHAIPLALFGHSMGARIAFELARRLDPRVIHLFASGSPTPGATRPTARPTADLDDAALTDRVRALGGTPAEILADPELMRRALPIVRNDFVLIERYRVEPQARVTCPITVFAGADDPAASPATCATWSLRTTSRCRIIELDAGHFFLASHRTHLLRELRHDLAVTPG